MNRNLSRFLILMLAAFLSFAGPAQASPWKKKQGYWEQLGGKFSFGLKHSLFSCGMWWTESREPEYKKEWIGFTNGIGKSVVYTAAGLIQLVTFPIPVDFPDIGLGMHIPTAECPRRHDPNYVPPAPNPPKEEAAAAFAAASAKAAPAPKPAPAPLVVPPAPKPAAEAPKPVIVEAKTAWPQEEEAVVVEKPKAAAPPPSAVPAPVTAPVETLDDEEKKAADLAALEKELALEDALEETAGEDKEPVL